jgi:iron complex outermembrane receptor protein
MGRSRTWRNAAVLAERSWLETSLAGVALSAMVFAGTAARGADAAAAASASAEAGQPTALGEIIVTAQKRSQNIQATPIAVTAFTSKTIQQAGLTGPQNLQFNVPSLVFGQESGFSLIGLRGIGSDVPVGGQPGVALYLDGVYNGNQVAAALPTFDLERIEVLRGPQGTLYGRNATGGVINYITAPPSFTLGGFGSVSYGNYNTTADDLGITGPILGDKIAFRLGGHYGYHDGYRYNLQRQDFEDGDEVYNVHGAFLFKPGSNLSITIGGDETHDRSANPYENISQGTVSGGVSPTYPLGIFSFPAALLPPGTLSPSDLASLNGGSIASKFGLLQPGVPAPDPTKTTDFSAYQRTKYLINAYGINTTIDWNPGPVDVKSITGYRYTSQQWISDSAGLGTPEVDYTPGDTWEKQVTQEFDVSGKAFDNKLQWLVGFYYLHADSYFDSTIYLPTAGQYAAAFASFLAPPGSPYLFNLANGFNYNYYTTFNNLYSTAVAPGYNFPAGPPDALIPNQTIPQEAFLGFLQNQTSQSIAGFFQGTYSITNTLRLNGGFRYTEDHTSVLHTLQSNYVNTLIGPAPDGSSVAGDFEILCHQVPDSNTWAAPTGTVGIDYDAAPRVLTYAKIAWGYKSGGFNVGACSGHYNPEYLTDYEGGMKAIFADGQVLTNLAIYYYDYNNIQFTTYVANASAIKNAGSATAFGVELEYVVQPRPVPGFQVDGWVSYEDSRYGPGCFGDPANLNGAADIPQGSNGLPPPQCPATDPTGKPVLPSAQINGNELIRAPRWKTQFGAQYTYRGNTGYTVMLRGAVSWSDAVYNDIFNGKAPLLAGDTQAGFWIVNARLVWTSPDQRYEAELFGENLSDTLYSTNRASFNTPSTVENVAGQFAPPRTFGVRFTVKLGSATSR